MNWTRSKSVFLSKVLVEVMFLILIAAIVIIPAATKWYDSVSGQESVELSLNITLYICDALGFALIISLYRFLVNIEHERGFVQENTTYLRIISWSLLLMALSLCIFALIKRPFIFSFAFIFSLLGVVIRVLKNVFDEAVYLQNEQDFTI